MIVSTHLIGHSSPPLRREVVEFFLKSDDIETNVVRTPAMFKYLAVNEKYSNKLIWLLNKSMKICLKLRYTKILILPDNEPTN